MIEVAFCSIAEDNYLSQSGSCPVIGPQLPQDVNDSRRTSSELAYP